MIENELHQLHSLRETAQRLSICLRTLRHHIDLRRITTVKIGRLVRVSEQEIRRVMRNGISGE